MCSVPDNCEPIGTEPTKVLIRYIFLNQITRCYLIHFQICRIYGENHHNNSSIVLKDVVLSAIMSDKDMGPKLYGVLPIGRIEEYIPVIFFFYFLIIYWDQYLVLEHSLFIGFI